jgi:lipoprotein-releasing system ATP-binding protein
MPFLEAKSISKTYRIGSEEVPVLRNASIALEKGEFVAVLGASGSGKSTLLHLLGGLDRPDKAASGGDSGRNGRIYFEGDDITSYADQALNAYRASRVGFVFQFYHLLPELTVMENATLPAMVLHKRFGYMGRRSQIQARANELLSELGLAHRLRHRPNQLSGGERQRVAIARALINDPPLLLADEPTGNLDAKTGGLVLDALLSLRAKTGRTMLIVTHDPNTAARADRIVHIAEGEVHAG